MNHNIIRQLKDHLAPEIILKLEMDILLKDSIVICLTVSSIIYNYHSTEEKERIVAKLLYRLCKEYFNG